MNVVILTFSGIPTTDYCLPLVDRLQKDKVIQNIFLLSNSLNSKNIFNQFEDSRQIMSSMNVTNIDLGTYSVMKHINSIFRFSPRSATGNKFYVKLLKKLERFLIKNLNMTIRTLKKINPDVVFFDHRKPESIDNYGKIFEYLIENKIKVYLTPHAPHYLQPKEHLSTDLDKNLTNKIIYLDPFEFSTLNKDLTNLYKDIICTSYPGFEDHWLDRINKLAKYENSLVVMLRPFHTDSSKWNKDEKVVLQKNELTEIIDCINKISRKNNFENIIVKPHPKNYTEDLEKYFLPLINHPNITLYGDSIYNLISKNNQFISTYSTTALVSIANQSPTYIINTEIFSKIFHDWTTLSDLYSKFSGFTTSEEILNCKIDTDLDKQHLKKFFKKQNYEIF